MKTFVTGASRGIGYSIAELLLKKEHMVTGTSRSSGNPFPDHPNYRHLKVDLADPEDIKETLYPLFKGKNLPDALINNAGIFIEADIQSEEKNWLNAWDKTLQVNLRAPALLCKWAIESWIDKAISGRIVNISSRAGTRGDTQEYAAYGASKGGLTAFTKSLARSVGVHGITAYTIAPGFVDTDMARESIEVYGEEYLISGLALDNIAPPEQIAAMVLPLAEGKLTHATGQTFHINSGSYLV